MAAPAIRSPDPACVGLPGHDPGDRRAPSAGSRPRPHALGIRRVLALLGPGAMVAVGYMDPGNWATDIAGGSRFSYALLSVVLASSLMAMLLQALSVRLGIATGEDLAAGCRSAWPRAAPFLWILAEIAVAATDLAEVLGSAIALHLLLGVPVAAGVVLTVLDVLVLLGLERRGLPRLQAGVVALVLLVAGCFAFELWLSRPDGGGVLLGYLPSPDILRDREMLTLAAGILGATVMPHNLYLHSSLVARQVPAEGAGERRRACREAEGSTVVSLGFAMLVNSAILVLAAAVFHRHGDRAIAELADAHRLLSPILGSAAAGPVFALALLAAGQSATLTGTLAGEVVMTGFVRLRLRPWARRLSTRALAIVPALLAALRPEGRGTNDLLIASQVILSLQLPFAVVPLLLLTGDRRRMGELAPPRWMTWLGWACAAAILGLNGFLLADLVT